MAALPVGKGYTPAQWQAWFTANTKAHPVFTGTYALGGTQLKGKTWAQVYAIAYTDRISSTTTPDETAEFVIELDALDAVGGATSAAIGALGTDTAASETGIDTASILPSWASGLTGLLSDLTSENIWLRVAKIAVGSVMIIVGLLGITGADKAVATAAKGALP
jgi:hypothetical protein